MLVRPELVVEIALDGVQTSTRYPGGVALRFARVKRYRPDKDAAARRTRSHRYRRLWAAGGSGSVSHRSGAEHTGAKEGVSHGQ